MDEQAGNLPDRECASGNGSLMNLFRFFLFACLTAAILYAANMAMRTYQARDSERLTEEKTVQSFGLITPVIKPLASQFTDSQGRLLADPPQAASQLMNPDTIVFAHIIGTDENPGIDWKRFETRLAAATGKKVADQSFSDSADQLAKISKNQITVLALHAADTPFLVNNFGFEPVAVLGADGGASGNHLDIIVRSDSPIASPSDLRTHAMVCTVPASITGYRAAVALLLQNQGLRPNVDYMITWSLGQKRSIMGVIKKQYEAAAVSDDKLQSLIDDGDVDKSQIRVIYQSPVIPRTTIGTFYNLNPQLADKIRSVILEFQPKQTSSGATEVADGSNADGETSALHFIPIDYKKDFDLVRQIDASFDPRLDAKAKEKALDSSTTQP